MGENRRIIEARISWVFLEPAKKKRSLKKVKKNLFAIFLNISYVYNLGKLAVRSSIYLGC